VLIFSGIVSYAYKQGSQTGVNATTPVVLADSKDYKAKPTNPGGMDVPFQDAVVFDQLQNKDAAKTGDKDKVESLLPPPEQPVANGAAPAAASAATTTTPVTATTTPAVPATTPAAATPAPATTAAVVATTAAATGAALNAATNAPATTTPAATTTASTPAPAATTAPVAVAPAVEDEEPAEEAPAPVKKAPVKKAAVKATPKATTTAKTESGSYRIQLGAFRDESAARNAWQKVEKQFSQLSSVTPAFPKADLGAKGIFYRAQGTNLSKASADSLCHTINASKAGSCIVTH